MRFSELRHLPLIHPLFFVYAVLNTFSLIRMASVFVTRCC